MTKALLPSPTPAARALSMTQPWASLVVSTDIPGGGKNIENRKPGFSHKSFRGEFYVHAARACTLADYDFCCQWVFGHLGSEIADYIPDFDCLQRGGIIGAARAVALRPPGVRSVDVPWHMPEQFGFVLEDRRRLEFVPCRGYLGFWRVSADVLAKLREAA